MLQESQESYVEVLPKVHRLDRLDHSGALAALKVVLVTADGKKRKMQGRKKGIKQGAGEWQTNLWVIGGDLWWTVSSAIQMLTRVGA